MPASCGKRGPRGGYRLAAIRAQITLGEVVRVVRKLEAETEPNDMSVGSPLAHEVVWPAWEKLREEMMAQLDGIRSRISASGPRQGTRPPPQPDPPKRQVVL